jgi:hypothetical protein
MTTMYTQLSHEENKENEGCYVYTCTRARAICIIIT